MTVTLTLAQVAVDCDNAERLAGFWSALLGLPVGDGANEHFALLPAAPTGSLPALMFLQVPEPRTGKNRLHLDLTATDRPLAVKRAVELGGTVLGEYDEYGARWTTLTDPEGNVFDIADLHH
ncbi:MAG TPA: VOC family protein [Pseudonocardia sp.]|jgi:predicted enzyme related to lactoylglutathione lyase|nr:VOC family protein [Pseudonocardia sp.]